MMMLSSTATKRRSLNSRLLQVSSGEVPASRTDDAAPAKDVKPDTSLSASMAA